MSFNRIKNVLALVLVFCLAFAIPVCAENIPLTAIQNYAQLAVNGTFISVDTYLLESTLYVPVRAICEAFGYEITWNGDERSVNIITEKTADAIVNAVPYSFDVATQNASLTDYANDLSIRVNGAEVMVPHFLYNGTTYVAIESLQTPFGCHIYISPEVPVAKIYSSDFVTFGENDAYYLDGQMLTNTQFQDVVKFISNAVGATTPSPSLLEQELAYLRACYLMGEKIANEDNFDAFLVQNDVEGFLESLGISDKSAFIETFVKAIYYQYAINDQNALAHYNPTEEELIAQLGNTSYGNGHWMKAKHILIMHSEDGTAKNRAQALLNQLRQNPEKFDALMAEYSEDPGSKSSPEGYLFTEGQMVTEFYEGTLALKEGQISNLVESTYGYHIILKVADYENGVPYTEVKDELHLAYAQSQFMADMEEALANVITIPNRNYTEQ